MPKKSRQSDLLSFFGAGAKAASPKKKEEHKENASNALKTSAAAAEHQDGASGGNKRHQDDAAKRAAEERKKKRRVIDDDSSDEEMEFESESKAGSSKGDEEKPESTTVTKRPAQESAKKQQSKSETNVADDQPKKKDDKASVATAATSAASTSTQEAKQPADTKKKDPPSMTAVISAPKPKPSQLAKVLKAEIKSDEKILADITWENELPYSILCQAFSKIEAITGRLSIQEIMTTLFRQISLKSPQDLYPVLYLSSNSVAPAYECVELGIGDAILVKAIGEATGSSISMIKEKYEKEGDLGLVAQNCKSKQKTLGGYFVKKTASKALLAKEVLAVFREIAKTKGNHAQKWKVESIKKLLVRATDPLETKYIIRGLQGKLRIGLAQSTVLISLAHSLALTIPATVVEDSNGSAKDDDEMPEEAKTYMDKSVPAEKRLEAAVAIIKKAYSEVPSYDSILEAALKVPLQRMYKACALTPGIPVSPMLAKPTKSVQEVLKRLNGLKFTCEYKYDGERAQVHLLPDGKTKVFSRNLLDTSDKYPEVPLFVKEASKDVQSFVLDAEVVAYNNKTGQLVPFQILSTRKKTEESAETAKVQVIVQAFDIMYLNGKSLLNHTLAERRQLLKEHFVEVPGKFKFAESMDHVENGDTAVIEDFLEAAIKGQCEGLMVKTLEVNAIYEPSRRSLNWLKLKKDYLDGLGDSVDLVPLGAYHGRGKRTGVYGAYLLACYDPDTEEFQSVCKIGTGFSDEDLKTLSESLNKHIIPQKSSQYNVTDQLACDVWFDACQVWEVKAADLSKSSAHRGAEGKVGEEGRGIGLRFPRFERLRDDKLPEEATTSDQILEMYYAQDAIAGDDGAGDDDGI